MSKLSSVPIYLHAFLGSSSLTLLLLLLLLLLLFYGFEGSEWKGCVLVGCDTMYSSSADAYQRPEEGAVSFSEKGHFRLQRSTELHRKLHLAKS